MDSLRAMRTFVRIVDDGSLTAAARSLGSSVPAVVRTLAALESHLRVRLLHRTTRRIALTDDGRRYLEASRRIVAELDDVERSFTAQQAEPSGLLTITAPVLYGQQFVAPAVTRFVQRYDRVHCNLMFYDRVVNLVEEGIDVGIRIGHLSDSTLVAQQLGTVRRVVVASPAYLRVHGIPRHPRDLLAANCFHRHDGPASEWQFTDEGRTLTLAVRGNLGFNQFAPAIQACLDGLGFGLFLSYQVESHVERKRLRVVLERFELPPWPLHVVYPHARLLPSRTRALIDWLKRELRATAS